jgi:hypothetical protein
MKCKKNFPFILVFWLASFVSISAANVTLSWNPSSSTNAAGYNIYYGTTSGIYPNKIDVGNVTTATISNLCAGVTYYFTATTYDNNADESSFSNEDIFIVPGVLQLSAGTNPGDPMLIEFPVEPGHWYEIQATSDFQTWTTIWRTDVVNSNQWLQFADTNSSAFGSRCYRLALH